MGKFAFLSEQEIEELKKCRPLRSCDGSPTVKRSKATLPKRIVSSAKKRLSQRNAKSKTQRKRRKA